MVSINSNAIYVPSRSEFSRWPALRTAGDGVLVLAAGLLVIGEHILAADCPERRMAVQSNRPRGRSHRLLCRPVHVPLFRREIQAIATRYMCTLYEVLPCRDGDMETLDASRLHLPFDRRGAVWGSKSTPSLTATTSSGLLPQTSDIIG